MRDMERVARLLGRRGADPVGPSMPRAERALWWGLPRLSHRIGIGFALAFLIVLIVAVSTTISRVQGGHELPGPHFDAAIEGNAHAMLREGQRVFRFETFGDEAFWGGVLGLHHAIAEVTPRQALTPGGQQGGLGLKVDVNALPKHLIHDLNAGRVNLDDPGVTVALLKMNAVVGVTGKFDRHGNLTSFGIQCALCHSTVDNSLTFGIGGRLDGWANRDLDPGKIIASAPNLAPLASLLSTDVDTLRLVLLSWGPGKFDAEILLDGKAFNPQQVTNGVVTGTNVPGATLIPNAFGLAGFNQHTWTGAWGSIPYWNALVANLEMGGVGRFFDPRLNNATQFPIAAKRGAGNVNPMLDPDSDQVTKHLGPLQFYQLAIPSPKPRPGFDFNFEAAKLGDKLFSGKARCNTCHVEPLWSEPGWNLHPPEDIKIDSFQANRAPSGAFAPDGTMVPGGNYKTMSLAGVFVRENARFMAPENAGRFYHDGRFKTLTDVVNSYNVRFSLGLTPDEVSQLVEYLKALFANGSGVG